MISNFVSPMGCRSAIELRLPLPVEVNLRSVRHG